MLQTLFSKRLNSCKNVIALLYWLTKKQQLIHQQHCDERERERERESERERERERERDIK
jgi:hypothetical protein